MKTSEEVMATIVKEIEQAHKEGLYGFISVHFKDGVPTRFVKEKSVVLA